MRSAACSEKTYGTTRSTEVGSTAFVAENSLTATRPKKQLRKTKHETESQSCRRFSVGLAFTGLTALLVLLIGPLIRTQVSALFDALPDIARQVEQVWFPSIAELLDIDIGDDVGVGAFLARYSDMAGTWGAKVLVSVTKSGGALAAAVLSAFLIPILTFYLLRDWDSIMAHLGALIPSQQRQTIVRLATETDEVLGAFLRGQLLVMLALATLYSIGLSIVGLKFAIAIGVVSGLVSFVPYLGLVFGIALASLTVVLEPSPLWPLVGVIATFTIAQMLEGSVLTPKLVGDRIGLQAGHHYGRDPRSLVKLFDAATIQGFFRWTEKWEFEARQTFSLLEDQRLGTSILVRRYGHDLIFEIETEAREGEGTSVNFSVRPRLGFRPSRIGYTRW